MAVYKIPQDVEADDKFVGPLSFKQFIFAGIAAVAGYLSFISLSKGFWPALIFLIPIIVIGGFLGFPWGRDQPTEIWLAARIRFFIKPRVRIWNQSGIKDLVTITVPKKIEKNYTNGLTQNEVQSRLNGLATLIDSRGWAIKNASNDSTYINQLATTDAVDDRLLNMATMPQEVSEVAHTTDILDESSNSTALHFDEMIKQSEQKHREAIMQNMQSAMRPAPQATQVPAQQQGADFWFLGQDAAQQQTTAPQSAQNAPQGQAQGADFWFLGGAAGQPTNQASAAQSPQQQAPQEPAYTTFNQTTTVAPHTPGMGVPVPVLEDNAATAQLTKDDEEELLKKVHTNHLAPGQQFGHLKTIMPLGEQSNVASEPQPTAAAQTVPQQPPQSTMTTPVDPAIIKLASNDDLNIDTIARQAHQQTDNNDGEVVISLR